MTRAGDDEIECAENCCLISGMIAVKVYAVMLDSIFGTSSCMECGVPLGCRTLECEWGKPFLTPFEENGKNEAQSGKFNDHSTHVRDILLEVLVRSLSHDDICFLQTQDCGDTYCST